MKKLLLLTLLIGVCGNSANAKLADGYLRVYGQQLLACVQLNGVDGDQGALFGAGPSGQVIGAYSYNDLLIGVRTDSGSGTFFVEKRLSQSGSSSPYAGLCWGQTSGIEAGIDFKVF